MGVNPSGEENYLWMRSVRSVVTSDDGAQAR